MREVQARALGRGTQLVGDGEEKWEVSQLLFADDTGLVADSKEKLDRLVEPYFNNSLLPLITVRTNIYI